MMHILFGSTRGGSESNIYIQASDATGSATRWLESNNQQIPTSMAADGMHVVFHEGVPGRGQDLRLLTLALSTSSSGQSGAVPAPRGESVAPRSAPTVRAPVAEVRTLLETRFQERGAILSPDDRWLAYDSNGSGRFEISRRGRQP